MDTGKHDADNGAMETGRRDVENGAMETGRRDVESGDMETTEQLDARIREAEAQAEALRVQKAVELEVSRIPTEVTCVIPFFNAWLTLPRVLFRLEKGAQDVPLDLVICDNSSDDPIRDAIYGPRFVPYMQSRGFRKVTVLDPVPQTTPHDFGRLEGKPCGATEAAYRNMIFMWSKLLLSVETEFVLFVDSDVEMPVGGVRLLLERMKADPRLGELGLQYDWDVDHVEQGCTMARRVVFKDMPWRLDGCPCRFVTRWLRAHNWKVEHVDPRVMRAAHLKNEM